MAADEARLADAYALMDAVQAALALHEPQRLCVAHHITDHDCPEPQGDLYRCFTCRTTNVVACRTWRTLTGKEKP